METPGSLTIMTTQFDSLDYAQRLERAGVPEDQAAVHAQVLQQALGQVVCTRQLTTSEDGLRKEHSQTEERLTNQIHLVRDEMNSKIERVRIELDAKIDLVRVELEAKIERVRVELETVRIKLEAKIDKLEAKIDKLEARIDAIHTELVYMRWMIGVVIALNTALLVKIFSL